MLLLVLLFAPLSSHAAFGDTYAFSLSPLTFGDIRTATDKLFDGVHSFTLPLVSVRPLVAAVYSSTATFGDTAGNFVQNTWCNLTGWFDFQVCAITPAPVETPDSSATLPPENVQDSHTVRAPDPTVESLSPPSPKVTYSSNTPANTTVIENTYLTTNPTTIIREYHSSGNGSGNTDTEGVSLDSFYRQVDKIFDSVANSAESVRNDMDTEFNSIADSFTTALLIVSGNTTVGGNLDVTGTLSAGSLAVTSVSSGGAVVAPYFTATSTTLASTFPYASTTALSVSGLTSSRITYAGTGGILQDSANLTFDGTTLTANTLALTGNANFKQATATALALSNMTLGSVPFIGTGGALMQDNANFFWDDTNNRFGIGTTGPQNEIHIAGTGQNKATLRLSNSAGATVRLATQEGGTNLPGILVDTNHSFVFYTNALERMRLTNTGNVGIGTTSPFAKLSVHANAGESNTSLFSIGSSTLSATTTLFTVLNNGNVGVGTANPGGAKLAIVSDSTVYTNLSNSTQLLLRGDSNPNQYFAIGYDTSLDRAILQAKKEGTAYEPIILSPWGGNVGIGVQGNPSSLLTVAGGVGIGGSAAYKTGVAPPTNGLMVEGNVGIGTTTPTNVLDVSFSDATSVTAANIQSNTISGAYISNDLNAAGTEQGSVLLFDNVAGRSRAGIAAFHAGTNLDTSQLAFYTHQSTEDIQERVRIDYAGNVGIGTTSPAQKLDVAGNLQLQDNGIIYANGSGDIRIANTTGTNFYFRGDAVNSMVLANSNHLILGTLRTTANNDDIIFQGTRDTGTSTWMTIKGGTGNVGIGTTSPYAKLAVHANAGETNTTLFSIGSSTLSATTTLFTVLNNGNVGIGTASPSAPIEINGTSAGDGLRVTRPNISTQYIAINDSDGSAHRIQGVGEKPFRLSNSSTAHGFEFYVNGAATQALTINNLGNVGIGTTSPGTKLDVRDGTIRGSAVSGAVALEAFGTNAGSSPYIQWYAPGAAADKKYYRIGAQSGAGVERLSFETVNDAYTSSSEKMVITNNGNVGIGTTSPWGKLSVHANNGETNKTLFAIGSSTASATTTHFVVTNTGNVGIGTTNPGVALDVVNDFRTGNFRVYSAARTLGVTVSDYINVGIISATNGPFRADVDLIEGNSGQSSAKTYTLVGNYDDVRTVWREAIPLYTSGPRAGDYTLDLNKVTDSDAVTLRIRRTAAPSGSATNISATVRIYGGQTFTYDSTSGTGATVSGLYRQTVLTQTLGNVGIGTTSPWQKLSVAGGVAMPALVNDSTGYYVCLNTTTGQLATSTTVCGASSLKFKENVEALSYGLSEVLQLNPVFFTYKPEYVRDGRRQLGFIAEEVDLLIPEVVARTSDGEIQGLDYPKFTAVLAKAIQELWVSVVDLKDKVASILGRLAGHDEELAALKARVAALEGSEGASAAQSQGNSGSSSDTATDTEAPVITINGENPAHIAVGATYSDLGATVTDNVDHNLGIKTFVDMTPIEWAAIETKEKATYHINYVATDNAGNSATSTRTVIVDSAAASDADVESPAADIVTPEVDVPDASSNSPETSTSVDENAAQSDGNIGTEIPLTPAE